MRWFIGYCAVCGIGLYIGSRILFLTWFCRTTVRRAIKMKTSAGFTSRIVCSAIIMMVCAQAMAAEVS
jgi:hypothetical protein